MNTRTHRAGQHQIVEVVSTDIVVKDAQDALDLMFGTDSSHLVLHEHNFESSVFDLSSRKLGEILQKFINYRVHLAVIGDFEKYPSKALRDFIHEINRHGDHLFVSSLDQIINRWSRHDPRREEATGDALPAPIVRHNKAARRLLLDG